MYNRLGNDRQIVVTVCERVQCNKGSADQRTAQKDNWNLFDFYWIFRCCEKVIFAHLYTPSLSIVVERIPFDTGIKWIYSGYIFSFAKMRRPTIHLFLSQMKGRSLLCSNFRFIYSDCKKICFQPNISSERRVKSLILRFLHAYMHANQRFIGFHLCTTQKVEKNNDQNITPD